MSKKDTTPEAAPRRSTYVAADSGEQPIVLPGPVVGEQPDVTAQRPTIAERAAAQTRADELEIQLAATVRANEALERELQLAKEVIAGLQEEREASPTRSHSELHQFLSIHYGGPEALVSFLAELPTYIQRATFIASVRETAGEAAADARRLADLADRASSALALFEEN